MPGQRISISYRRKTIIAFKKDDSWEARSFDDKKPSSQIHVGATSDEAIMAVKADLDLEAADERSRRGSDGFPTVELVQKAFARIRPSDGQLAMLIAHLNAPDHILTATELASAAGKDSYEYANAQYGRLARDLAEEMEYTPSQTYSSTGQPVWTFTLATGASEDTLVELTDEYVEWRWKLRPQMVEAMKSLGID